MESLLYLHFDVVGSLLDAARECEEEVFLSAFGNTREQLDEEYGPYDDQSIFMAVADADGDVLGSCRLIVPGPAGLKTLNDVARSPWHADGYRAALAAGVDSTVAWDIATLGVRRSARGNRMTVASALLHGLAVATRVNQVPSATAILDSQIRRILNSADYIMPALPGLAPAPYLGSAESVPVYAHYAAMLDGQRRSNPDAYRLMTLGIGLDGVSVPGASGFLRRVRAIAPAMAVLEERELLPVG
jgi:hypothetical protein